MKEIINNLEKNHGNPVLFPKMLKFKAYKDNFCNKNDVPVHKIGLMFG